MAGLALTEDRAEKVHAAMIWALVAGTTFCHPSVIIVHDRRLCLVGASTTRDIPCSWKVPKLIRLVRVKHDEMRSAVDPTYNQLGSRLGKRRPRQRLNGYGCRKRNRCLRYSPSVDESLRSKRLQLSYTRLEAQRSSTALKLYGLKRFRSESLPRLIHETLSDIILQVC